MTKRFNPNKCPYKQLMNHHGAAIVYVSSYGMHSETGKLGWHPLIIRYVSRKKINSGGFNSLSHCVWASIYFGGEGSDFDPSCFATKASYYGVVPKNYQDTIAAMKKWDKKRRKIVHIEFFDK